MRPLRRNETRRVARILQRNSTVTHKQAEVVTNNAGLRSSRPYRLKKDGVFRIVCLGDSFVYGAAGKEEDRFADQIEAFYATHGILADDREIEVYAVGIGSWTMVQEVNYLASRISEYDPDVIVVLTTPNDITEIGGVTGRGFWTQDFSPEYRDVGSGVFSNQAGGTFGLNHYTALTFDMTPESRARWRQAVGGLARLVDLQHQRGKHILLSSLDLWDGGGCFRENLRNNLQALEVEAPFVLTSYFPDRVTQLPHDSHPSRAGHAILATHYLHAMSRLGWVPVAEDTLPQLHEGLSLDFAVPVDSARIEACRQRRGNRLPSSLDFENLEPDDTLAFLGGILPEGSGPAEAFGTAPWASVRSGFLLRRPTEGAASRVEVEVMIPRRVQLFPLRIEMSINGHPAEVLELAHLTEFGPRQLSAELPPLSPDDAAVEIVLRSSSYFASIGDPRMKSFRLISAHLR